MRVGADWEGLGGFWVPVRDGDDRARGLYRRHYSARRYRDGRRPAKFAGPGEYLALLSVCGRALLVWRRFRPRDGQDGVCCAVFRNEGAGLSSELLRQGMAWAWRRWPGARLYTYVDPGRVLSANPGYCFLRAGWRRAGRTKGGLIVLEAVPDPAAQEAGAARR